MTAADFLTRLAVLEALIDAHLERTCALTPRP